MFKILTGIILAAAGIMDIRKKEIPVFLFAAGGVLAVARFLLSPAEGWIYYTFALAPGLGMLFVSLLTREKVGYGDGIFLVIIGLLEGGRQCMAILGIALLLASLFSVLLLICKKASLQARIPFVPFVFISYLLLSV